MDCVYAPLENDGSIHNRVHSVVFLFILNHINSHYISHLTKHFEYSFLCFSSLFLFYFKLESNLVFTDFRFLLISILELFFVCRALCMIRHVDHCSLLYFFFSFFVTVNAEYFLLNFKFPNTYRKIEMGKRVVGPTEN